MGGMMIKLKKAKAAEWLGVAMGSTTAEWLVAGHENIAVRQLGIGWFAIDLAEKVVIDGRTIYAKLAKADTRKELVAQLERILD